MVRIRGGDPAGRPTHPDASVVPPAGIIPHILATARFATIIDIA